MKIMIEAYEYLDDYLEILQKYNFEVVEYSPFARRGIEKPIEKGTIEISSLDELFELAESIHKYFKSLNSKDDDLLVITYKENKFVLEIYDGYRE
jgi:hypothetical protein